MTQVILFASNWLQEAIEGLVDLVKEVKSKAAVRRTQKETFKALSALSDHDLKDIGIGRSDITSISIGTFHNDRTTKTNNNLKGWV